MMIMTIMKDDCVCRFECAVEVVVVLAQEHWDFLDSQRVALKNIEFI